MQHSSNHVILGIDISKDKLDIWMRPHDQHMIINNNPRHIGQWIKSMLKDYHIEHVFFEPTGGYEKTLIRLLLQQAINPTLIHPNRLVHFVKSLGTREKSDKIDAKNAALFGERHIELFMLDGNYVENKRLAELSSRRRQLKEMIHRERCRISHDFFQKGIKGSHKRLLKALEKELKQLNELIEKVIEETQHKQAACDLLKSMKGVGKVLSETLVVDLPELGTLSKGQIAKLVGVAPIVRESGKWQGERHIYGGRGHVRKVLYMGALVAVRYNRQMKEVYEKLLKKGKPCKVALVAVMRRMLSILNAMIRDMKPYEALTD